MSTPCEEISRAVNAWVSSGEIGSDAVERVRRHLLACASCAPSVRPLLELMERDAGVRVAGTAGSELDLAPDVTARVLARVSSGPARAIPRRARVPVLAVAAVLVLALGVGLIAFRSQGGPSVVVRFELAAPEARSVFLVGDFTDWEQQKLGLEDRDDDGLWEITIRLQEGRAYSYNFLIDGEAWVVDPGASLNVDDGFGGKSSVIVL